MIITPRRRGAVLTLSSALGAAALVAALPAAVRAAANGSIRLVAERSVLRPDGASTTEIIAYVYDDRGNLAPDGTRVRFLKSGGGQLNADAVATQNGLARVVLTAANQPGQTTIQAFLETQGQAVPVSIVITFTADADTSQTGASWVRFNGDAVGYVVDDRVIQATGKNGGARLEYRDLEISADTIQFDVTANTLKAVGHVTVKKGSVAHTFEALRFALQGPERVGERIEDGRVRDIYLTGETLAETPPPPGAPQLLERDAWAISDLYGARVTVTAKSIALEPNTRLQFRRATFYLDGQKAFALPFHIMNVGQPQQQSLFTDQIVGVGSSGVSVDVPFYYDVRPSSVGTLHWRRGAPLGGSTSAYSSRPGWSLDAVQTYNGAHEADGQVELTGLARGDWNALIRHGQRLDKQTTGSVFVNVPNSRDASLTTQVTRDYKTFQVNLTGSGTHNAARSLTRLTGAKGSAGGDVRGQLFATTYSKPVARVSWLQYALNAGATRQGFYGGGNAVTQGTLDTQSAGGRLFTTPITVGKGTRLSQAFTLGQTWAHSTAQARAAAYRVWPSTAPPRLSRSLNRWGEMSVNYNYDQISAGA